MARYAAIMMTLILVTRFIAIHSGCRSSPLWCLASTLSGIGVVGNEHTEMI